MIIGQRHAKKFQNFVPVMHNWSRFGYEHFVAPKGRKKHIVDIKQLLLINFYSIMKKRSI